MLLLSSSLLPLRWGAGGSGVWLNSLMLSDVTPGGTVKYECAAGLHEVAPSVGWKSKLTVTALAPGSAKMFCLAWCDRWTSPGSQRYLSGTQPSATKSAFHSLWAGSSPVKGLPWTFSRGDSSFPTQKSLFIIKGLHWTSFSTATSVWAACTNGLPWGKGKERAFWSQWQSLTWAKKGAGPVWPFQGALLQSSRGVSRPWELWGFH